MFWHKLGNDLLMKVSRANIFQTRSLDQRSKSAK